jgi:hypothetical protein
MQLKGVFYAEFDNVMGPRIVSQAPQNCLSADHFEAISDYIITGKQLCGKLITVSALGLKVMGYPLCIANKKVPHSTYSYLAGIQIYFGALTLFMLVAPQSSSMIEMRCCSTWASFFMQMLSLTHIAVPCENWHAHCIAWR